MNNSGRLAELKAADYLIRHRYKILDYNYKSRFGEIDIIAKKGKYIVFCEVKMRDTDSIAKPMEFVDEAKQAKIIATTQLYLAANPTNLQPRFDVIEVFMKNGKIKSIKALENAFQLV
ncbi:MAG: YraN family protein [Eubacterium sp.]|nr:YraN family protein [Eubacterium sp.]